MSSRPLRILGFVLPLLLTMGWAGQAELPRVVERVDVFAVPGKYGGWPANHGIWSWGNEILVGFSLGDYKDLGPERHNMDRDKPEENVLARSLDGGRTWSLEYPARQHVLVGPNDRGSRMGTLPPGETEPEPIACPGGIDFLHPGFAMTLRMVNTNGGESRFYYSYERGRTWQGPFRLPLLGQKGIAARTDYLVNARHDCFVFLTASKSNEREGRVICGRTTDGGKTFQFQSYIGPEPTGYSIMPSTVRLSERELFCTIRRKDPGGDAGRSWIEGWRSRDNGQSWEFASEPADTGVGNPPALLRLKDGRLCLIYGFRAAPYEIRALLSGDGGKSWSPPFVLEGEGGGRDLGYPRAVQRPDGRVVAVYYFQDRKDRDRKIRATVWDPGKR